MKVRTAQADQDYAEFIALDACCSCHINPPCNYCTHPGNPANQNEDDECWEETPDYIFDSMRWKEITSDEFFATVGQMGVNPTSDKVRCLWRTRFGRIVGISDQGYIPPIPARPTRYYVPR